MAHAILDTFDAIFLINLDRSQNRLRVMDERLFRLRLEYERFPAIDRYSLGLEDNHWPNPGHLACAMSHAAVYRLIRNRGYESAIILEDDAIFRDDAVEKLKDVILPQLRKQEWDMFYLGAKAGEKCGKMIGRPSPNLIQFSAGWHAHAYAVHDRAIDRLLAWTEGAKWHKGGWFDGFSDTSLKKFVADPMLAIQDDGASNIDLKWATMNRIKEYAKIIDGNEFVAHCKELQER